MTDVGIVMAMAEVRIGRGRAHGLLARLLLEGLDARSLADLCTVPGWLVEVDASLDLDACAAAHHACLQRELHAYAGVFLTREALAGAAADLVHAHAHALELRVREAGTLAGDHLGVLLSLLAAASPHADLDDAIASLLDACVLSWLPALVVAGDALEGMSPWPAVLRASLELCAEQRLGLAAPRRIVALPSFEDPLTSSAGLRQIAEFLACPAASGVFVSHFDITGLARPLALPRGFGSRVLELDNLLRSAVELERMPELLDAMAALWRARDAGLEQIGDALALQGEVGPWRAAIGRTLGVLARMREAAGGRLTTDAGLMVGSA